MALETVTTEADFSSALAGDTPVLVDFSATWCAPCKLLEPVLTELSEKYVGKVRFVKVDVEKLPDLANRLQVRSVPTMFIFHKGIVKKQLVGGMPKERLKVELDAAL